MAPHLEAIRAALPYASRSMALALTAQALAGRCVLVQLRSLGSLQESCMIGAPPHLVSPHLHAIRQVRLVSTRSKRSLVECGLTSNGAALLDVLRISAPGELLLHADCQAMRTTCRSLQAGVARPPADREAPGLLMVADRG